MVRSVPLRLFHLRDSFELDTHDFQRELWGYEWEVELWFWGLVDFFSCKFYVLSRISSLDLFIWL
jgi:hypothetical protein